MDFELRIAGSHHIFARTGVAEILNLQSRSDVERGATEQYRNQCADGAHRATHQSHPGYFLFHQRGSDRADDCNDTTYSNSTKDIESSCVLQRRAQREFLNRKETLRVPRSVGVVERGKQCLPEPVESFSSILHWEI
jgi:hypothetical protein